MNKFKVGDKVAIYNDGDRGTGQVILIRDDGSLVIMNRPGDIYVFDYHPKQCRKLVKKKVISDEPSTIPDVMLGKLDHHIDDAGKKVDPKFKVGDFVYLTLENNIGMIKVIGVTGEYGKEYGLAVLGKRYDDCKFDVYQERVLNKLNIKCED